MLKKGNKIDVNAAQQIAKFNKIVICFFLSVKNSWNVQYSNRNVSDTIGYVRAIFIF